MKKGVHSTAIPKKEFELRDIGLKNTALPLAAVVSSYIFPFVRGKPGLALCALSTAGMLAVEAMVTDNDLFIRKIPDPPLTLNEKIENEAIKIAVGGALAALVVNVSGGKL